jgi:hypothetical protein
LDVSDNDILDAVKRSLSGVHLDRPVETIKRRGRNRRRVRALSGVAGGGLAMLVGAAVAVPMLTGSTGATPARSMPAPAAGSTGSPQLEPAAWSVDLVSDKTVRLTLRRADFTDVGLLEKKLADVKVPAFVRIVPQCEVHGTITAAAPGVVTAKTADDLGNWPLVYTIRPSAIPPGTHLIFTTYPQIKNDPRMPIPNNVDLAPAGTSVACKK